ncbi:TPA: phage tail protein, partial [Klebsiella pneumoniae]|nr:phage tail protein [Klebsiella pneumoniae]
MTVSTQVSRNEYTGNGATTQYDFTFRILDKSHLLVQTLDTSESIVTLTLGTDYTVTGVNRYNGGKVVLTSALPAGYKISIERSTPVTQEASIRNQGGFFPEIHEDAFDKLTMLVQQAYGWWSGLSLRKPSWLANYYDALNNRIRNLRDPSLAQDAATKSYVDSSDIDLQQQITSNFNRSLRVPDSYISQLPSAQDRAWKGLGFDGAGQPKLQDPAGTGLWGYVPAIGSFEKGSLLNQRFEVLLWESTDEYWRWDGAMPKSVSPGSTPETAGGKGKGKWIDVTDATLRQNLGSGEPGMGADMLAFRDMLGRSSTVGDYLRDAYIRVHSRYELLQAIEHINNDLQHPAEIRLARNFASWNDAKTDIDITYASIVGEGGNVVIDAQGIPDAAGNYFMRIFNSKKSDINNLANIFTVKQQGLTVIGPGRNSNVAFNVFHSPEGQGAGFMTLGITAQEFGVGDTYGQNAYIIKHIGRAIQRCVNHVWMPSGYSNYGEGIGYTDSLLSTSSGIGVRNDNPNGAIRFVNCSLDYMGRIAVTNGGRIEFSECHIEVNNASNKLTGIPFETASSERAEIVVSGGEIIGFSAPLPAAAPTIFRCGANTNGIKLT